MGDLASTKLSDLAGVTQVGWQHVAPCRDGFTTITWQFLCKMRVDFRAVPKDVNDVFLHDCRREEVGSKLKVETNEPRR